MNVIAKIQHLTKRTVNTEPLSLEEKRKAKLTIIKLAQQDAFREELNLLSQRSGILPCNHQLYQFDQFLQDDIIRVGRRLRRGSVPFDLKHLVILPKDGGVTHLVLAYYHWKLNNWIVNLLNERVNPSPLFTYSGMDCFGPYLVKKSQKENKRNSLFLTCLCSRAIHIEMLENMTTDARLLYCNSWSC